MSEKLKIINQALRDAGYIWLSCAEAVSKDNPYNIHRWYGPNGIVLVLHNGDCLETFADWPLGLTFDEFKEGIKKHE